MGSLFSKDENHDYTELEINRLKDRLVNLESIDKNNDGIISKDEITEWMDEQKKDFEQYKNTVEKVIEERYRKIITDSDKELINANQEIKELQRQITSLKKINDDLQKEINDKPLILSTNPDTARSLDLKEISKVKINQLVDEILSDNDLNIKYLPDWVEKRIYRNVLRMVIGLADHMVDTTSVNFLGHKLIFDLVPQQD